MLLLVEDDEHLRRWVVESLRDVSFTVTARSTLEGARDALREPYDLILLDLGLPDGDGLELCTELRARGTRTPIIVLTARGAPEERVRGLDAGADDYLTKPFHLPELVARIQAVLRRSQPIAEGATLSSGEIWIDSEARTAGRGVEPLDLKRREFDLLHFFLRNPGRAWTRAQLLDRVWGYDFAGEERTVDLHVARLRARIEPDPSQPRHIKTVWGVGYKLAEDASG